MVATVLHPRTVPITIPSTSPMAHPVRQCSVAEKAVLLSELFQVAINILPARVSTSLYTPMGYLYTETGDASYLRRSLRPMVGVRLGVCILVCGERFRHRGGTVALRVRDPYGESPHRRQARPRGGRGGLGRRFLLGRHLCRGHGHVRPVGRDGSDGDAHREGEDRGRIDAASPAETVEVGPRDGRPRPFVQRAPRLAGRAWSPGGRWFLEGGGTDRQEGSCTASRRESGDTHRVVERGAVFLCGRALPGSRRCPSCHLQSRSHASLYGWSERGRAGSRWGGRYATTGCLRPRLAGAPNRRALRPIPSARSRRTSGRTEKRTTPSTSYGRARRPVKTRGRRPPSCVPSQRQEPPGGSNPPGRLPTSRTTYASA